MGPFRARTFRPLGSLAPIPHSRPSCAQVLQRQPQRWLHLGPYEQTTQPSLAEKVYVHRPRMVVKKAGLVVLYTVSSWILFGLFADKISEVFDLEGEQANEPFHDLDEEGDQGFFVPFQYPQKLPKKHYKQSDPEWQEFVRLSNDESRADAVREELANRCARDVARAPKVRQMLGSNIELGHYWLDIKYPDGPAPEYQRWGIEFTDDYIALAQQTIPHSHYVQLEHLLWPRALFIAAFNSLLVFGHLQLVKLKGGMGISLNEKDKQISAISKIEKGRMRIEAAQADLDSRKDSNLTEQQRLQDHIDSSGSTSSTSTPKTTTQSQKSSHTSSNPPSNSLLSLLLPTSFIPSHPDSGGSSPRPLTISGLAQSTDFTLARRMFLHTLSTTWSRTRLDKHPPGCFYVLGAVEVRGLRGRVRCDIQAAYDPKGNGGRGEIKWCVIQVRNFWEWKQRAKGGP